MKLCTAVAISTNRGQDLPMAPSTNPARHGTNHALKKRQDLPKARRSAHLVAIAGRNGWGSRQLTAPTLSPHSSISIFAELCRFGLAPTSIDRHIKRFATRHTPATKRKRKREKRGGGGEGTHVIRTRQTTDTFKTSAFQEKTHHQRPGSFLHTTCSVRCYDNA